MRTLIYSFLLLVMISGCTGNKEAPFSSSNFDLIELSDGVYACVHKLGGKAICNAGIIDNGKETIVFDCFLSPQAASELLLAAESLNLSPVKYLVNSHAHNDHIRGNQVFPKDVSIISTSRTAELTEEWEPEEIKAEQEYAPARFAYYDSLYRSFEGDTNSLEYEDILMWRPYYEVLANSHKEVKTRLPDTFVDEEQNFDGPDRRVKLITKGAGHTESDLILYLPEDDILFTADLIFNDCHPYMAHGSISGLKEWLDYLHSLNAKTVVPGHGPIGTDASIAVMKDYIHTLENLASEMVANGKTVEETGTIEIPEKYKSWWFDRFFYYNLKFVYNNIYNK